MAKREKIILLIMAVAVIFGVYNYFFKSSQKIDSQTTEGKTAEIKQYISDLSAGITQGELSETQKYTIKKASLDWTKDPFLNIKLLTDEEKKKLDEDSKTPKEMVKLIYSGYVNFGNKKLAIINGIEYEVGDELIILGGYIVQSIDSTKVEIGRSGGIHHFTVALEEKSILPKGNN